MGGDGCGFFVHTTSNGSFGPRNGEQIISRTAEWNTHTRSLQEQNTHTHQSIKNKRRPGGAAMFYNHSRQLLNNLNHFARKALGRSVLSPRWLVGNIIIGGGQLRPTICLSFIMWLRGGRRRGPRSNLFITRNIDCIHWAGYCVCVCAGNMIYQQNKPYRTV